MDGPPHRSLLPQAGDGVEELLRKSRQLTLLRQVRWCLVRALCVVKACCALTSSPVACPTPKSTTQHMQAYNLRMQAGGSHIDPHAAVEQSDEAEEGVEPSPSELPPPCGRHPLAAAAAPSTSGQQQQQQQQQPVHPQHKDPPPPPPVQQQQLHLQQPPPTSSAGLPPPGGASGGSGGGGRSSGRRYGAVALAASGAPAPPAPMAVAVPAPAAAPLLQLAPVTTPAAAVEAPDNAAAPKPLEMAETPIANLAVRLFHDPPTTGQRPGAGGGRSRRSSVSAALPPKQSPQLQLQQHQEAAALQSEQQQPSTGEQQLQAGPWIQTRKPAQQQQQPMHAAAAHPRPHAAAAAAPYHQHQQQGRPAAPQLHLTRPVPSPKAWDAQSQACGRGGGWAETQPNLGPGWARLESQCGATWSPPRTAAGAGRGAGVSEQQHAEEEGGDGELGGAGVQDDHRHPQRGEQQAPHRESQQQPELPVIDGGTQPPPGWEGTQPGGLLGGAAECEEDADVVPPTPVKTGEAAEDAATAEAALEGTVGGARAGGGDRSATGVGLHRQQQAEQGQGLPPSSRPSTLPHQQQQRKRRLPSLGVGAEAATPWPLPQQPDAAAYAQRLMPPPSSSGASAARRGITSAPGRMQQQQQQPGFWHSWQPRGLPAAGPSAHASIHIASAPEQQAAAVDPAQRQAQLRLQLGAAVRRILPVKDGECGVLLDSATAAASSASKGGRSRVSLSSGTAATSAYRLLIVSMSATHQQQQRLLGGIDHASFEARGTWELEVCTTSSSSDATVQRGLQLMPAPEPPLTRDRGASTPTTLLAAVAGVSVSSSSSSAMQGSATRGQPVVQATDAGVNVWHLSGGCGTATGGAGSGRASARLLQALPTDGPVRCTALGKGCWLAAAGEGGHAFVWPLRPCAQAHQRQRQNSNQQGSSKPKQGGWIKRGQVQDTDEFLDAPTQQNQREGAAHAAALLAAAPVDEAGRVALPQATLRGMPFPEVSELCFITPHGAAPQQQQDGEQGQQLVAGASGGRKGGGWLLAGCSSAGALALWDVDRGQLLVAAFPSLGGLSRLLPVPLPHAQLPVVLLACVPAAEDGAGASGKGNGGAAAAAQQLAHVVLHAGGAAVDEPLALHMSIAAAAACGGVAAAVSEEGGVVAWDLLQGSCLLRGALPVQLTRSSSTNPAASAAAEMARGQPERPKQEVCVGFLSAGVLAVGTAEGALHLVLL